MDELNKIILAKAEIADEEALIKKGLCDEEYLNDKYLVLYKNYKNLFDKYLLTKLSLQNYEDRIINSDLKFIPLKHTDMEYYQYISTMNLHYIYSINDIYVEKLAEKDIDRVINLSEEELIEPSQELLDLVAKTYEDVITSEYSEVDGLQFGIRQDDFADNGIEDSSLRDQNYDKQLTLLKTLSKAMETDIFKITGKKATVKLYNDFNIDFSKEVFNRKWIWLKHNQ